jgi:hypothetical protein
MKAKVYRSGTVEAPVFRGVEASSYHAADAVRPAGRMGRTNGIFASPSLSGVARWAHAKSSIVRCDDPFVREITVDPSKVFVYSVHAWERASSRDSGYEEYWNSGMTLTEWSESAGSEDPDNWELLLDPADIVSTRPVSDKRLLQNCKGRFFEMELIRNLSSLRKAARRA